MGTWGNKLYEDDDADDARGVYKDLLAQGFDGPEATDRFLKIYESSLEDSDDGPILWFVLADTQWKLGRLEDRVRDKAIELIDDGSSLDRWREAGGADLETRQQVLAALKQQLLSPQPPRKAIKVKKPAKIATWKAGELVRYRLRSGQSVVLCLEEIHRDHHARLSALDWIGDELPDAEQLKSLLRKPITQTDYPPSSRKYTHWQVVALAKRDVPYDRMTRLGIEIPLARPPELFGVVKEWRNLDALLKEFYGWK